jgi:N-acetylmuramoyl-L-alanine amidase
MTLRSILPKSYRQTGHRAALVVLLLAGCMMPPSAAHIGGTAPAVERISLSERADGQGFVLRVHTTGQVHAFSEPREVSANEYEVTLFNTDLGRGFQNDPPRGPVQRLSTEPRSGHLVVRFHLDDTAVDVAAYRDRGTTDVLVGITYRRNAPVAAGPRTGTGVTNPGLEDARERWRLDTIVIDAGHGGRDPGAVANGLREKDITLAIALRVGRYIEDNLGVRVVYTRNTDRFVELRDRGRIANEAGGKLFVSIHANSARDRSAFGTETFFLGASRSEAAQRVMERENSVIRLESNPDHYAHYTDEALIRRVLTHSAYMRKSEQLAGMVESQFSERVGRRSRGVKQANFYVLWGASMPAILVELGFITNPAEAAFMGSEQGQTYLASAIFRAVRDFKEQYERGLDVSVRAGDGPAPANLP